MRFFALIALVLANAVTAARAADRPNVIFFLSDDHRADFLGCAGHPIIKTPHIDRLAAEGVRFSNAFVTTSICAASRASIFTGLYERTHRFTFGTPPIREEHVAASYPAVLKAAGYRTGFIGKFGVGMAGNGQKEIFDFFKPINRSPYFHKMPDGTLRHETDLDADAAIEFIKGNPAGQPFCLSVSFNAAHAEDGDKKDHYPYPPSVADLYTDLEMPPPKLPDPAVFESQPEFLQKSMNRDRYFWRWDTPEKYQHNTRNYFRMISGLDAAIGRVLEELKAQGLDQNTVVIFSGDNGYYQASRGFAGKWSHYEESLRVPLVVFDPRADKAQRGRVDERMALNIDIPATMLAYAGAEIPAGYQGRSLTPIMEGKSTPEWRSDTFCEHLMDNAKIPKWEGVRGARYVYARYFEQSPPFEFLHDLQGDPDQLKNLTDDPAHAEALKSMRARCDELRDSYGGKFQPHSKAAKK